MSSDPLDERLLAAIKGLQLRFGDEILDDRRRLTSMLGDLVPEARRQTRLLGVALEDGVPRELRRAPRDQLALHMQRLAGRIENLHGIRPDFAQWAVAFWIRILDIPLPENSDLVSAELEPAPSPGPTSPSSDMPHAASHALAVTAQLAPSPPAASTMAPNAAPQLAPTPSMLWARLLTGTRYSLIIIAAVIAVLSIFRNWPDDSSSDDDAGPTPATKVVTLAQGTAGPDVPVSVAPGQLRTQFMLPGSSVQYTVQLNLSASNAAWESLVGRSVTRGTGTLTSSGPDSNGNRWYWSTVTWAGQSTPGLCLAAFAGRSAGIANLQGGALCVYEATCRTQLACGRMTVR